MYAEGECKMNNDTSMKMEKDTMITLDDNTTYVLLDETEVEGSKYFFAVKIDEKTKNPTTEYEVFEEEVENGDTYMSALDESDFKQAIMIDFLNNYMGVVGDILDETEEN